MKSPNEYLGDEKFKKFLEHYNCPTSLDVVKAKFAGAICSPNMNLRPTDVISSFWEQGKSPRLETKEEADLFFKFFMGLWDEIFKSVKNNKVFLSPVFHKTENKVDFSELCDLRYHQIEYGFVEGFWGGQDNLRLPPYLAEIIDSLSQMAEVYLTLQKKAEESSDISDIEKHFRATDKMVEKAISFVIENSVLPRIESLQRIVH